MTDREEVEDYNLGCRVAGWLSIGVGAVVGTILEIFHYVEAGKIAGFLPALLLIMGSVAVAAFWSVKEVPDE